MMPFFFTPRSSPTPRPITFLLNRNHPHPPSHIDDNDHACGLQALANIANAQYHELNNIESTNDIFTKTEMPSWEDGSESWDSNNVTIASLNDLSINPLSLSLPLPPPPPPHQPPHQPPQPQAWQANSPQQYAMQNHQHHNQHPQYYASSSTTTTASASNSSDNSPLTTYHSLYTPNTHQGVPGPSNTYPPLTSPYQELPPVASYPSPSNIPPNNPYSPTGGDPYTHTHTFTDHTSAYETLQQQEAELKRLRNTAASARFRAKKKKREASLERNAREKREQLERLEERIRQLEKENTWLRELVLRKGERIGKEEERVAEEKKDGVGTEEE